MNLKKNLNDFTNINLHVLVLMMIVSVNSEAFNITDLKQESCELSYDQQQEIKDTSDFKLKLKNLASLCVAKNYTNLNQDEIYFFSKWGQKICKDLMSQDSQYPKQCRYGNLIANGQLNIAEAMAIAGYTAQYYLELTPENIQVSSSEKKYKGFDIFNRVLSSAIAKLSHYPEYQYNEAVYRGTSMHGKTYEVSKEPFNFGRWLSSSCVEEKAFGPQLINMDENEKSQLIADFGADTPIEEVQPFMFKRDPKFIPKRQTTCQQIYYKENPTPPLTAESHFGHGDLSITILPPASGSSKRVAIYGLSDRPEEAEILFSPDVQFVVENVIQPNDSMRDRTKTQLILREVAQKKITTVIFSPVTWQKSQI